MSAISVINIVLMIGVWLFEFGAMATGSVAMCVTGLGLLAVQILLLVSLWRDWV